MGSFQRDEVFINCHATNPDRSSRCRTKLCPQQERTDPGLPTNNNTLCSTFSPHKDADETFENNKRMNVHSPEPTIVSDSDVNVDTSSRNQSLDGMMEVELKGRRSFEKGSRDWEYMLSWGCQHVSDHLESLPTQAFNLNQLINILDECSPELASLLDECDMICASISERTNTFDLRLARCNRLVYQFCMLAKTILQALDQKMRGLSEVLQCGLQKVADEVSLHNHLHGKSVDAESSPSWPDCREIKMEIIELENSYDRIHEKKNFIELKCREQLVRQGLNDQEMVIIDLGEHQDDTEVELVVEEPRSTRSHWLTLIFGILVCCIIVCAFLYFVLYR